MSSGSKNSSDMICLPHSEERFRGIFYGDNPLDVPTPLLFLQLSVPALLTATLQFLFTPLGESAFFSQMLTGILMGPTFWEGENNLMDRLFPPSSHMVNQTFAFFGCMLFLYIVGVKTDLSMVKRTGKKAVIIGLLSFLTPISLNLMVASILRNTMAMDEDLYGSIYFIASFLALNSFHVVVCLLADLNLLNSELGRLATSSSLVCGGCSWAWAFINMTIMQGHIGRTDTIVWMFVSFVFMIFLIVYVCRPVMMWMERVSSEGKPMKESHVCVVFLMILGISFFSEFIGYHMIIGPMFLGMATPDGPPLGSSVVDRLDSYISAVLLPSYFTLSGSRINIRTVHWENLFVIEFLSFSNFIGRFMATALPSLYCKMPTIDAVALGLIMSAQGITDVLILQQAMYIKLVDIESYTIMSLTMVIMTGIITPLVKYLYRPSQRYLSHKRRTIEHAHPNSELRMLAGIYSDIQAPTIISLLELSNPTPKSPICFYVVHLLELLGRSAPLLIPHRPDHKSRSHLKCSDHIVNAFRLYERNNQDAVVINLFTSVSPYVTMHDEVCCLAWEKRVSMAIIPFHKQWSKGTQIEELPMPVRTVNQEILQYAPSSVGILVDRGTLTSSGTTCKTLYSIGMIFVEGPDDREALAYLMRMGEHPGVCITVTRLVDMNKRKADEHVISVKDSQDERIINDFRIAHVGRQHHTYKEELVLDSVGTVGVIRSVGKYPYDLLLVGRRHDNDSPLFVGLTEWNEFPELGFIGDMLVSSDSGCKVSVLVVQQQTLARSKSDSTAPQYYLKDRDSSVVVNIQKPNKFSSKVHPGP